MVKIRNVKKFKNYNMRIVGSSILLICKDSKSTKDVKEYDIKQLLRDVYDVGKNFNIIFNEYCKVKKEEINYDVIHFDKVDLREKNEKIINLFKNNCSSDFKKNETTDNFYSIEIDKYVVFYNFYENSYNLLKEKTENIGILSTPSEIHQWILEDKYGIIDSNRILDDAFNKIELNYQILLDILEENKIKIDYSSLINSVNFIPMKITHLFNEILENKVSNTYSKEIFKVIEEFCTKYGLPYWKENIYDKVDVEIPMNNFIFISLAIFIYMELWSKILEYDNFDEWESYIYSFNVLNINFYYGEEKKLLIEKLVNSIESIDFYIMNNCNELLNRGLNIYRKKVLDKNANTLGNEIVYDSIILAVWDLFYLNYFGTKQKFKPNAYLLCNECNKEIRIQKEKHKTKDGLILCKDCFNERKREQGRKRVENFRNKNS